MPQRQVEIEYKRIYTHEHTIVAIVCGCWIIPGVIYLNDETEYTTHCGSLYELCTCWVVLMGFILADLLDIALQIELDIFQPLVWFTWVLTILWSFAVMGIMRFNDGCRSKYEGSKLLGYYISFTVFNFVAVLLTIFFGVYMWFTDIPTPGITTTVGSEGREGREVRQPSVTIV